MNNQTPNTDPTFMEIFKAFSITMVTIFIGGSIAVTILDPFLNGPSDQSPKRGSQVSHPFTHQGDEKPI